MVKISFSNWTISFTSHSPSPLPSPSGSVESCGGEGKGGKGSKSEGGEKSLSVFGLINGVFVVE